MFATFVVEKEVCYFCSGKKRRLLHLWLKKRRSLHLWRIGKIPYSISNKSKSDCCFLNNFPLMMCQCIELACVHVSIIRFKLILSMRFEIAYAQCWANYMNTISGNHFKWLHFHILIQLRQQVYQFAYGNCSYLWTVAILAPLIAKQQLHCDIFLISPFRPL